MTKAIGQWCRKMIHVHAIMLRSTQKCSSLFFSYHTFSLEGFFMMLCFARRAHRVIYKCGWCSGWGCCHAAPAESAHQMAAPSCSLGTRRAARSRLNPDGPSGTCYRTELSVVYSVPKLMVRLTKALYYTSRIGELQYIIQYKNHRSMIF